MSAASGALTRARAYWDGLVWGLTDLRRWLGTRGLWPEVTRLALTPQGARWRITGDRRTRVEGGVPEALLIGEPDVLWGEFTLPAVGAAALEGAVSEALWRVSPLPPDQVVMAWRAQPDELGGWRVVWGVCPARVVVQGLAQVQLTDDAPVYLVQGDEQALLARGAATALQRRQQRRLDGLAIGGLVLVALALMIPLSVPLLLKRQAVVRSMTHMTTVEPMAAPVRKKLDELHQLAKLSDALTAERQLSLPVASALNRLAEKLPEDAWLDRLEASDRQVRMMGLASNATDLMTQLSKVPEFAELRTTAPTVRDEGQSRERFSFEFTWRDAESGAPAK
ncbi:PilN domain-containing protein [Ottowia sp. GY511]|uniref:PilN domain-containing protein n=1 Tax=Ottowia flava TaxID=2675430 RepID=A0ABW4KTR6_9BURK|nr:PilN domain-containing protein [Ottowia sp. GY511]TXK32973.1 PilN domain-containing protein [Ottowia sp. GY511]